MPSRERPRSFLADFRLFFFRGLGVLLPSVLTLWILIYAGLFVQRSVAEPINSGVRQVVIYTLPLVVDDGHLPEWFRVSDGQVARLKTERLREARPVVPDAQLREAARARNLKEWWDERWYLRIVGLIIAIVLIYLSGRLLGGLIGKRIYSRLESAFQRLPVVAQIYPHVKQVVDVFFGGDESGERIKFNRVVLVEYPRRGIWAIGFISTQTKGEVAGHVAQEAGMVSVFVPTTPNPTSGFLLFFPEEDVILLDMRMPEMDGMEVLRQLRKNGFSNPVAMLTTSSDERDLVESLRNGADDEETPGEEPDEDA